MFAEVLAAAVVCLISSEEMTYFPPLKVLRGTVEFFSDGLTGVSIDLFGDLFVFIVYATVISWGTYLAEVVWVD